MKVNTQDLILIIGKQQIEIEMLRNKLGNLSGGGSNDGMESGSTVSPQGTRIVTREKPPRT